MGCSTWSRRIDLKEVELSGPVQKELHRAGIDVTRGTCSSHSGSAHTGPQVIVKCGGRGFFDDFLVPTLYRALTLEEMHHVTVSIGQDLKFHMPGRSRYFSR